MRVSTGSTSIAEEFKNTESYLLCSCDRVLVLSWRSSLARMQECSTVLSVLVILSNPTAVCRQLQGDGAAVGGRCHG